jgi:hypothetical protein
MTPAQKETVNKAKEKYQGKLVRGKQGTYRVGGVWLVFLEGSPKIEVSLSETSAASTPVNVSLGELEREYLIVES